MPYKGKRVLKIYINRKKSISSWEIRNRRRPLKKNWGSRRERKMRERPKEKIRENKDWGSHNEGNTFSLGQENLRN